MGGRNQCIPDAAIGAVTPLLDTDVGNVDGPIALNVTALARLTHAAAPAFVARGRGTIMKIASIAGISPETLNSVYGASKALGSPSPSNAIASIRCSGVAS